MNLKKKFVIGAASVALVAGMGGVAAPAAVAVDGSSLPGFISKLARFDGADRVQTSLLVADHEFGSRGVAGDDSEARPLPKRVYIASGDNAHLIDAAAAGMLIDGPIVFVSNNVYVATAVGQHFANGVKDGSLPGYGSIEEVVAIGGDNSVLDTVAKSVAHELGDVKVSRLAGADRYATSVAIANYIYTQAQDPTSPYRYMVSSDSNLNWMFFANGADAHVVDSMVAGTLDQGPVLLSNPDGKIPEVVAEFIKKTLPEKFAALGGTAAVPDSTVQDAWVIKALANKWETSPVIPNLKKSRDYYKWLAYGFDGKTGIKILPEMNADFGGLDYVVDRAEQVKTSWDTEVNKVKQAIADKFNAQDGQWDKNAAAGAIRGDLNMLYGNALASFSNSDIAKKFLIDAKNDPTKTLASGVNYTAIEKTAEYQAFYKAAANDLEALWTGLKQDVALGTKLKNLTAIASQEFASTAAGDTSAAASAAYDTTPANADTSTMTAAKKQGHTPLVTVRDMAKYTLDTDKEWFAQTVATYNKLSGDLRGEIDKIAPKTELRLGGADRFETAQLIANQWAKLYASEYKDHNFTSEAYRAHGPAAMSGVSYVADMYEAYVANAHRLPDSLTAGQLTQGPILLVKGDEKSTADFPKFTTEVATNLECWIGDDNFHPIAVWGVGGKAVLADDTLRSMGTMIGNEAKCTANKPNIVDNGILVDNIAPFKQGAGAIKTAAAKFKDGTDVPTTADVTVLTSPAPTGLSAKIDPAGTLEVKTTNATPAGSYKIRVSADGKYADVTVTVKAVLADMTAVTVTRDNATVNETGTVKFTCTPTPATATGTLTYKWTFSGKAKVGAPEAGMFTIAAAPGNVNEITLKAPNGPASAGAVTLGAGNVKCEITQPAAGRTDNAEKKIEAGNTDTVTYNHS